MIDKFFTKSFTSVKSIASYVGSDTNNNYLQSFIKNQGVTIGENGVFNQAILIRDWRDIWLTFTVYSLIIAVLFMIFFKHKHTAEREIAIEAIIN